MEIDTPKQRGAQRELLDKLKGLNIDDEKSLNDFKSFLDYSNIGPIVLGSVFGSHFLQFVPDGDILDPDEEFLEESLTDDREELTPMVLGMWPTKEKFLAGRKIQGRRTNSVAPLEVFLQLGKLYAREEFPKGGIAASEMWYETNFVLVMNLEDDSLWVIRKKFITYEWTWVKELASRTDWVEWDKFPGIPGRPVVFGRLASSFDALEPGNETMYLSYVQEFPEDGQEPVLVSARRTEDGGIRRTNDYAFTENINPEVDLL